MNNSNNNEFTSKKNDFMKPNNNMLPKAIENALLNEFESRQSNHTQSRNIFKREKNKEKIEENRNLLNAHENLVFDFIEGSGLWIIGGYGPVDKYPEGLEFEKPTSSDLPDGAETFLPYLTKCDAAEGFDVWKFNAPFLVPGNNIDSEDIFFIQCTNNGTTYFACSSLRALRSFVLCTNEKIRGNRPNEIEELFEVDESFVLEHIPILGWWVIGNNDYNLTTCWPLGTAWASDDDLKGYGEKLYPELNGDFAPVKIKSLCRFTIPFWKGGREIKKEFIYAIQCADNKLYYAAPNQDALRSFVLWTNECIRENNELKKCHLEDKKKTLGKQTPLKNLHIKLLEYLKRTENIVKYVTDTEEKLSALGGLYKYINEENGEWADDVQQGIMAFKSDESKHYNTIERFYSETLEDWNLDADVEKWTVGEELDCFLAAARKAINTPPSASRVGGESVFILGWEWNLINGQYTAQPLLYALLKAIACEISYLEVQNKLLCNGGLQRSLKQKHRVRREPIPALSKPRDEEFTENEEQKFQPEYTVTGIRYQMGDNLTFEEMTAKAEQFVAGLRKGQKVMLMAEPNNPVDPNAIAVYVDFDHIGYISKEEAGDVHNLLDDKQQCDGSFERTDGHVTFFITIPDAKGKSLSSATQLRKLPQSPLGENVKMPFTKEENKLGLLASQLEKIKVSKDNIREVIGMAEKYIPLLKLSVCHEETFWMNKIAKKLENMYKRHKQLDINDADAKKLNKLFKAVREAVSDMHCTTDHWTERVFVEHLDRLRNNESVNKYLYKQYCDTFLDGKFFADADKALVASEHERLCGWLKGMKWSELRNPQDLESMGMRVNYLGLSRQELYDLYSVLLLIEKLEMSINAGVASPSIKKESGISMQAGRPSGTKTVKIPSGAEAENNEITSKFDHFVKVVKKYKFFECPAVACLNETQLGQLVRKIVSRHDKYGAYAIAMLCELDYDKWMIDNYAKDYPDVKQLTKGTIHKHWAEALCLSNPRTVAGNYNVIRNPNSKEDKGIYKAADYTIVVHNDYIDIKNSNNNRDTMDGKQ